MFEHPEKLIAEMQEIMKGTDEQIIAWLKKNSEEYKNATVNAQKDMVNGWQQTLDDTRGYTKTYWDEVQSIIAKGDNAIISFLKKNSEEYKNASKQQAAAYVDEWKKQLEDLKKAHQAVTDQVKETKYDVIEPDAEPDKGTSESKSSSGYSVRGTKWAYKDGKKGASSRVYETFSSQTSAKNWANRRSGKVIGDYLYGSLSVSKYAQGGLADYTGLAWLDGSKSRPERVLSPVQTELFESMVKSLEEMAKVRMPMMPYAYGNNTASASSVSVGDIIVNVDKLDSDQDYEEMAEKVFDYLMETLNRGAVVGGIRVTR